MRAISRTSVFKETMSGKIGVATLLKKKKKSPNFSTQYTPGILKKKKDAINLQPFPYV